MTDNNIPFNTDEYNMTVNEFAKVCMTTRDTLRHYYEIGLLMPAVNPLNGYHYYSPSQIASFYYISSLKSSGCSLDEIAALMADSANAELLYVTRGKIESISLQIESMQKRLSSMLTILHILEHYDSIKDEEPGYYIMDGLSVYASPIMNNSNARHVRNISGNLKQHIEFVNDNLNISPFPLGATISLDDIESGNYVYNSLISLTEAPADNIHTHSLAANKVVNCFHTNCERPIADSYKKLLDFIKSNNLTPVSDLYSISIINLRDSQMRHNYLKFLFICIE